MKNTALRSVRSFPTRALPLGLLCLLTSTRGLLADLAAVKIAATPDSAVAPAGATFSGIFAGTGAAADGRTAFTAAVTGGGVGAANDTGVWHALTNSVTGVTTVQGPLVREGDAAPGLGGVLFSSFGSSQVPLINTDGRVFFSAGLAGAAATADTGVWTDLTGSLVMVLREGDVAPGQGGVLYGAVPAGSNAVDDFYLQNGSAVFRHTLGTGATTTNDNSLWLHSGGGSTLIMREANAAPGMPAGAIYTTGPSSSNTGYNAAGQVAFLSNVTGGAGITAANDTGIWLGPPASPALVFREGVSTIPGLGVHNGSLNSASLSLNNAGQIAFTSFGTHNGVFAGPPASLAVIAQSGSAAPGTAVGVNFSTFQNSRPSLSGSGKVAFANGINGPGVAAGNDTGAWTTPASTLRLAAREGDSAPATAAGVLIGDMSVSITPLAQNDRGQVAFRNVLTGTGVTTANDGIILAADPAGQIIKVAREGDAFTVAPGDVRTISSLSLFPGIIGSNGEDGHFCPLTDAGRLVFTASFTGGSSGVLHTDLSHFIVDPALSSGSHTLADGATYNIPGDTIIGRTGTGSLTLSGGTILNSDPARTALVAEGPLSLGNSVTVSGTGTRWNTGSLTIGDEGAASVTIQSGAQVVATPGSTVTINALPSATALFATKNVVLQTGGELTCGSTLQMPGSGFLQVNGGLLNCTGTMNLGYTAPSAYGGFFVFAGASTLVSAGVFNFANSGTGHHLSISDGANLTANEIHFASGGTGNVLISGAGTTITTSGNAMHWGSYDGSADISLSDSAVVTVPTNWLYLGFNNFSPAARTTALVSSGAALNPAALSIGSTVTPTTGGAFLQADSGGSITTGQISLRTSGRLTLNGGTLTTGQITANPGGQFHFNSGTLRVTTPTTGSDEWLDLILGSAHQLSSGRSLRVDGALTLTAPLVINGGTLLAQSIVNPHFIQYTSGTVQFADAYTLGSTSPYAQSLTVNAGQKYQAGSVLSVLSDGLLWVETQGLVQVTDGPLANQGQVFLNGPAAVITALGFNNFASLRGSGRINAPLTNNAPGEVRVESGQRLEFTAPANTNSNGAVLRALGGTLDFPGTLTSAGQADVIGGILRTGGLFTNSTTGFVGGRDALLAFDGGLTNAGRLGLSFGNSDVFGDLTNQAGGRIVVSGGSTGTFYGSIANAGSCQVSTGSTAVVFGLFSGNGVSGAGTVFLEGGVSPGFSPGLMTFGGDLSLGGDGTLTAELGGTTAGTLYDQISVAGHLALDGTLDVLFINGFTPSAGMSFNLWDAATHSGAFFDVQLPILPPGLQWNTTQLYTTGEISVIGDGLTFAAWATASGIPGALPASDHDSDGYDNATEFALGLFPALPGSTELNGGFHTYIDGERLRLLFTRPLDRTGVTLKVQASDDLATWTDVAVSVNSAPFTGPGFVSENRAHPLTDPGLVEVRDILNTSTTPRRQMRVRVEIAP